ncbi:hypothetical protein SSTU70S_04012 [Stutzerimonas stutzeri]
MIAADQRDGASLNFWRDPPACCSPAPPGTACSQVLLRMRRSRHQAGYSRACMPGVYRDAAEQSLQPLQGRRTSVSQTNPHLSRRASGGCSWHSSNGDFLELVGRHGVPYHEKKLGQLFCDNKSSDILEMLLAECSEAGVELHLNTAVQAIEKTAQGYALETGLGPLHCQSLVIATGGLSIPTLGASGFGYQVARQLGHTVLPTRAGLVPFTITEPALKALCGELSGTSVDCRVSCNGQSFRENLLFTHRGLSGPAMLESPPTGRPARRWRSTCCPSAMPNSGCSTSRRRDRISS